MDAAVIVFPHQLFKNHPYLKKEWPIFLVEDSRFFSQFHFHKQKLILHRASMKAFASNLQKRGYKTHYIEGDLEEAIDKSKARLLYLVEPDDVELSDRLKKVAKKKNLELHIAPSPGFLTQIDEFKDFFKNKDHFRCDTFYIYQRKKFNLLLDENGKPLGGKWSFDKENQKKLPSSVEAPLPISFGKNSHVEEAMDYVEHKFSHHPGSSLFFNYPTTHAEARKALKDFCEHRLYFFGDYEDAIKEKESILFHSALSPLLNIGLLTPDEVIEKVLEQAQIDRISLNNLEGFIRQVVGWREFIRGLYHCIGFTQKESNFFNHHRKMPPSFYEGTTRIAPLDKTIEKVKKYAYVHHIERLMVLGNFFFLCEISPKEVYQWFMELFIDSYDWVMTPNIFGMSQYADGGKMTTKPYFTGSNYILKMSDYPKGEWCEIWDALFWRFMIKHLAFFEKQPRLNVLSQMAKKKSGDRDLTKCGENFIKAQFQS